MPNGDHLNCILLQVAAIVLAAVYKSQAGDEARKFAKYTLKKYHRDAEHRDAVTLSWDFMMAEVNSKAFYFWREAF